MKREPTGSITVFLALIFVCVVAIVLTLVESARTAGLKYHLDVAADSALDNVFSEYHNDLWDKYRITAYLSSGVEGDMSKVETYMQPYLDVDSWMSMDSADVSTVQIAYLTDNGGEWFEQETIDYMNYGLVEELFDIDTTGGAEELWNDLKEATSLQEITEDYAKKSKEALEAEEALTKIDDSLKKQNDLKDKAISSLKSGGGSFDSIADKLISEMGRLTGDNGNGLVCEYEEASAKLEEEMAKVDEEHAESYTNLSEEGKTIVNSVKTDYTSYSTTEKNRRAKIEAIYSKTKENIEMVKRAKDAAEKIEELENEVSDSDDGGADYQEEIDALWDELAEAFSSMNIPSLDCEFGVENEEEKGFLESAKNLLSGNLLELVLPEGKSVSTVNLNLSNTPSHTSRNNVRTTNARSVVEKAMLTEYIGRYFTEFTDEQIGVAAYEMEYICAGEDTDKENLSETLGKVFAIREGMNYLSIMKDSVKRNEARVLATEIVGASGGTLAALIPVIECLIIGVWAGAESVVDLRALLKGNKVSLIKSNADWKLDARSILTWGNTKTLSGSDSGDSHGINYESYLKLIIMLLSSEDRNYRTLDLIQLNIARGDPDFLMCNCVYGMQIEVSAETTHLFTSVPLISSETQGLERHITLITQREKAY